jgi:hypothetical protein
VQGKLGDQGVQGKLGDAGAQGVQGKIGPPGSNGSQGVQGKIGPPGSNGSQGVQGKLGPQGPAGAAAFVGLFCPAGQAIVGFNQDGTLACSGFVQNIVAFSGAFVQGQASLSSGQQCTDYNAFRAGLTGTFSSLSIGGTAGPTRVCATPAAVATLVAALNAGSNATVTCNGFDWRVGTCGTVGALNAGPIGGTNVCQCPTSNNNTIRPCINNANWGGINTATCGGPSQTISVIATR